MNDVFVFLIVAVYALTVIPLVLTFTRQIKLIAIQHQFKNGLDNYRKALAIIVATLLLDTLYFGILRVIRTINPLDIDTFNMVYFGYPVLIVKCGVAAGAWLYYFIYKQHDLSFLSIKFWYHLFLETFHKG